MKDSLYFFQRFLRNPDVVASVAPTSVFGVRAICKGIRDGGRKVVVEYGPGTGAITEYLLKPGILTQDSKLIVIELDQPLAKFIRTEYHDTRLHVFHDTAEHVQAILRECHEEHADIVISGIPFSHMRKDVCERVMDETASILAHDGTFIAYQVKDTVKDYLDDRFRITANHRILLNIPPLRLYRATKNGTAGNGRRSAKRK